MCGITGIFAFNLVGKFHRINITAATMSLEKRGPDFQDIYLDDQVGLGHRRLSVIDTSELANQPMWDDSGRYAIIYNGEIFNYRTLRHELEQAGETFRSQSDTEVLLKAYVREGAACLEKLNGFFAFCIYDKEEQSFFIARDRYGVKPLLYVADDDKFMFASEMKALLAYGLDKTIDYTSLGAYLQLNYIPAPRSIFRQVRKLLPGHYLQVTREKLTVQRWYWFPLAGPHPPDYGNAQQRLRELVNESVRDRLVSDVPLGAFLSGGLDSSIIAGIAKEYKPDLKTFSIGFRGKKFFDETPYATLAAQHFKTDHTVFTVDGDDVLNHLHDALNYFDEPFADSSALNVYILSRETRKRVTVALSGDGADEIFAGYNKHEAFWRMLHPGWRERLVIALKPLWRVLPQSRANLITNRIRQFSRFATGAGLSPADRYRHWASFATEADALALLTPRARELFAESQAHAHEAPVLGPVVDDALNSILRADMTLVLPNDMLAKLDGMSMANGLEVRSPFLDYRIVDFAFSLPDHYKINRRARKRILRDAFRHLLPAELLNRPKKGFEVPLRSWLRHELRATVTELLARDRIEAQGIFHYPAVDQLQRRLFSSNPGDTQARLWAVLVFQWWWKRYLGDR